MRSAPEGDVPESPFLWTRGIAAREVLRHLDRSGIDAEPILAKAGLNREDAGNSRLRLHPARRAVADACIVDYRVEATELVDLVGNGPRPGNGRQVAGNGCPGAGRRRDRVATSTLIPPVYDDLMALLDQEPGRHETEAVR